MLDPPVSVIAQDPAEMGRHAALRLLSRLDGEAGRAKGPADDLDGVEHVVLGLRVRVALRQHRLVVQYHDTFARHAPSHRHHRTVSE